MSETTAESAQGALRIQVLSGRPSETEAAAIVATVMALAAQAAPEPAKPPQPTLTRWQRAARIESVQRQPGELSCRPEAAILWPG